MEVILDMNYYRQQNYQNDYRRDCGYNNSDIKNSSNNYNYDSDNGYSLAIAYVPWQKWKQPLSASEGLQNGTIFSDLIFPFTGCSNRKARTGNY